MTEREITQTMPAFTGHNRYIRDRILDSEYVYYAGHDCMPPISTVITPDPVLMSDTLVEILSILPRSMVYEWFEFLPVCHLMIPFMIKECKLLGSAHGGHMGALLTAYMAEGDTGDAGGDNWDDNGNDTSGAWGNNNGDINADNWHDNADNNGGDNGNDNWDDNNEEDGNNDTDDIDDIPGNYNADIDYNYNRDVQPSLPTCIMFKFIESRNLSKNELNVLCFNILGIINDPGWNLNHLITN